MGTRRGPRRQAAPRGAGAGSAGELRRPPSRFEDRALYYAWVPGAAKQFPAEQGRAVAIAFLDTERLSVTHAVAAETLLELGTEGRTALVDRAARLAPELVARAAAALDYADVRARLARAGVAMDHPALVDHPHAPPDLTLLEVAAAFAESEPNRACGLLERVARKERHPHQREAFERLFSLARGESGESDGSLLVLAGQQLRRLTLAGAVDSSFADGGILELPTTAVTAVRQSTGRLVIVSGERVFAVR